MTKHTPEPWQAHKEDRSPWVILGLSADKYGGHPYIAEMPGGRDSQANARRIVACVNACAGINPEAVPDLMEVLEAGIAYDAAIAKCGNDPDKMATYHTAQGDDLVRLMSSLRFCHIRHGLVQLP